jgi:hypothetical protein
MVHKCSIYFVSLKTKHSMLCTHTLILWDKNDTYSNCGTYTKVLIVARLEERNVLFLLFFLHTEVDKNDK